MNGQAVAAALPSSCEIVVVGGGVIGMACAEALSRRGIEVCVVERDTVGRAASWAGGGMLTPLPPDQCPDAIRALLEQSLALFPEFCARLQRESGIDPEYWVSGADYRKDGRWIHYPQLAQVRNPRLLAALAGTLRARGVPLLEQTAVTGWRDGADGLDGVHTSRGLIRCRAAVLAAGAWSAPLGADGITPAKGQMLLLAAPVGRLPRILIGDHVYLVPRRDGQILVGSTVEDCGFDTRPTPEVRERLLDAAAELWPEVRTWPVTAHWAGLRPRGAQESPLLGPHPQRRHLYLATGHFRIGLTVSPATAERVATMIENALALPAGGR